jgi:hypothetical protein
MRELGDEGAVRLRECKADEQAPESSVNLHVSKKKKKKKKCGGVGCFLKYF